MMVTVIPAWVSDGQEAALAAYRGGAFHGLVKLGTAEEFEKAVNASSDPMLRMLMETLSRKSGEEGLTDALGKISQAADGLRNVADRLAGRLLDRMG